tara:strand:+ start:69 stop:332 length:264 start_codon:yes stop_codon:yes gene_type:complete
MQIREYSVIAFIALLIGGCANFYDYKNVKNVNPKRKASAFRYDKKKCETRAFRLARSADAFILTNSDKSRRSNLYTECMKRRGWRER